MDGASYRVRKHPPKSATKDTMIKWLKEQYKKERSQKNREQNEGQNEEQDEERNENNQDEEADLGPENLMIEEKMEVKEARYNTYEIAEERRGP
ncbi:hypothetical protein BGZ65_006111 [Modicella reniformis]|uniref:Uncharacterized protein n=1 Tax=Modicella reniformis TaxID=1440133 RepID=A0A9P6IX01_9FUNG|nr:hypothetical protein BGZ65_006111 [Modicella reniformis]